MMQNKDKVIILITDTEVSLNLFGTSIEVSILFRFFMQLLPQA